MEGLFMKAGIKRVHMRHEQSATFAADAMARLTRRTAPTVIGPSTGLCNSTPGVAQAYAAQSPVMVIGGEHPAWTDSVQLPKDWCEENNSCGGIVKT